MALGKGGIHLSPVPSSTVSQGPLWLISSQRRHIAERSWEEMRSGRLSLSVRVAVTKTTERRLTNTGTDASQLWRLVVPFQSPAASVSAETLPDSQMPVYSVPSRGGGGGELSGVPVTRALTPFIGAAHSRPHHLLKARLLTPSHRGGGFRM